MLSLSSGIGEVGTRHRIHGVADLQHRAIRPHITVDRQPKIVVMYGEVFVLMAENEVSVVSPVQDLDGL